MRTDTPITLQEAAILTGLSRRTMARLFANEPGLIVLERPSKMNKRRYRSVRIPRAVFDRVLKQKLSFAM